jgi:malate dehydrogenase
MEKIRITVIGAGNVGATCANEIAEKEIAEEIVLMDIQESITKGKALDILQASPIQSFDARIIGSGGDYTVTAGSEVVVITAGVPRKQGMSRDDLIKINAKIVKEVTENAVKYSPEAVFIIVSNPLDVMTYVAFLASKKPSNKIFGMAGILDTARYKVLISQELGISAKSIHAILMGGHGDSMVPLPGYTSVAGIPVRELIPEEKLNEIIDRTKRGGTELVNLMGTSAWYAPGAAAAQMVEAVVKNSRRVFPVCASLNGEYGLRDIHLGVPVVLGRNGIEKVIELKLDEEEMKLVKNSARQVKELMKIIDDMDIFTEKYGYKNPVSI